MRRLFLIAVTLTILAAPAAAQIGKQVPVLAGTPEDKAIAEIGATTDPAKKLELLDKYFAELGKGDTSLLFYELYIAHFLEQKDYAKAFEYGDKTLAVDPDAFGMTFTLLRTAQESGNVAKLFELGERLSAMVERYKASPAPEGTDAASWQARKENSLADAASNLGFAQYAMYTTALKQQSPAQKAAFLERFVNAFPESPYSEDAATLAGDAYRQARENQKMVAFAQKTLQRNPKHVGLLLTLADFWTEGQENYATAAEYAKRALQAIPEGKKPEGVADDQWKKNQDLQTGLAHTTLGQIHVRNNRDLAGVEELKQAAALLKPYGYYFGRNQYFLGFALSRLKRMPEARAALTEAINADSPYKSLAQQRLSEIGGAPARKAPAKKRP